MTQRARSPVLGYNHNLRHGGRVYHVQTEDSGTAYARLYTHLFFEGTILSSKKQQYDPSVSEDVVRGLMQQLHKAMIKELTHGGHDPHITAFFASRGESAMLDGRGAPAMVDAGVAAAQPEPPPPAAPSYEPAPSYEAAPPSYEAAPPSYEAAPPSYEAAPPSYEAAPPSYEAAPASYEAAPPLSFEAPRPPAAAPPVARAPAPRPKPVVVIKPSGLKRPPVVLSSSADGVVVRRNVVINVGAGSPQVHGSEPIPHAPEPAPVRPRAAAAAVVVRDGAYGAGGSGTRVPEVAPQPLASSQAIHMPWESAPAAPPAPHVAAAPAPHPVPAASAPSDAPSARGSRQIRMPWDPPAPVGATDAFSADLVNDKSLDEVILEYLSDDAEPEDH